MSLFPGLVENKPLREVSTFGIGGPAEWYAEARTVEEMQALLTLCHERKLRFFVLGKGSNTLFDDRGFQGLVIHNKIDFIEETRNGLFRAGAGFSFSLLGSKSARKGWTGLEFASGIPGSVGGAVFMNAGANGTETCEPLTEVEFVTQEGNLVSYPKSELSFAYRSSSFHQMKGAVVAATFQLSPSKDARSKQLDIIDYRTRTQPYGDKSAGCMFRNPGDVSAGSLIDKCGLKGLQVGGASVSDVHANFIINSGNGTSQDVLQLIREIRDKVKKETGVELESEVRQVPFRRSDS